MEVLEALSTSPGDPVEVRRLRDGTEIGGWLLKAAPGVWDLEAALAEGDVPTSWRLAFSYRVGLINDGDPVVLWRTRGWSGPSGVVAIGQVNEPPDLAAERPGDPDDHRWVSPSERDRPRPRVGVALRVLEVPVPVERIDAVGALRSLEVRRVPRIGNPSVITPGQWAALVAMLEHR